MRYRAKEISELLKHLDDCTADDLENETIDFKECPNEAKLRELALEMAICMGNAQGGTIIFGVKDRVKGYSQAIVGINFAPDLAKL